MTTEFDYKDLLTWQNCDKLAENDAAIKDSAITYGGNKTFTGTITISAASNNALGIGAALNGDNLGFAVANSQNAADSGARVFIRSGGSSAGDPFVVFSVLSAGVFAIGVDNSDNDNFKISAAAGVGTTDTLIITSAGEITQPLQPSFLVTTTTGTDITGDGTEAVIAWDAEVFDQGSDFASNSFTAPVTGRYQFNVLVTITGIASNHTTAAVKLNTSNRTFRLDYTPNVYAASGNQVSRTFQGSVLADMDAGDTAAVAAEVYGGSKVIDIVADATYNNFSGSLIN